MQKRHHFIPDSYQRNFINNEGKVWVLDKEKKLFQTNPTNIFAEAYFYLLPGTTEEEQLRVENLLGLIETDFGAIYKEKINIGLQMTQMEKGKLSYFVACMYLRTKFMRNQNLDMYKKMRSAMQEWGEHYKNMSDEQKETFASLHHSSDSATITIDDMDYAIENNNEIHTEQLISLLPEIADILFNME
ncbi:MAG: hypothetical protein JWN37_98 [Candidatus Nomurabacteria bacterium]|nr:hypothetical protein [Candidatus Nomurabacteria bacterium]